MFCAPQKGCWMNASESYISTLTATMLTGKRVETLQRGHDEGVIQGMKMDGTL